MKKILTLALCLATVGSISAQKANVDAAKKLIGKSDKIADARKYIEEAKQNPETKDQALTWFTAGQVEFGAFDTENTKAQTVPGAKVDSVAMALNLVNGYNDFLAALPLDSVPNEKGQVKPKFSKKISSELLGHHNNYYILGVYLFNNQKFQDAYDAFYSYGEIASLPIFGKLAETFDKGFQSEAYDLAGRAAYWAKDTEKAADAFRKARLVGSESVDVYNNEIACYQQLQSSDSTKTDYYQYAIYECANDGLKKFGIENPYFIGNVIDYKIGHNQADEALEMVNNLIAQNPESGRLYGLLGYVYDRMDNEELSEANYRKAAELPGTDVNSLSNAALKLYRAGAAKLNSIEGRGAEADAARQEVKVNYFEKAKAICERGLDEDPANRNLNSILDSVKYALDTYF